MIALLLIMSSLFLGTLFYFLKLLPRYQGLCNTPLSTLRSTPQGTIKVEGNLVIGVEGLQVSPLTGVACLWWQYQVVEPFHKTFRTVSKNTSHAPIYLSDGTDICVINPAGAEIKTHHMDTWSGDTFAPRNTDNMVGSDEAIANLRIFQQQFSSERYRFIETRLEPGDLCCVLGEVRTLLPRAQTVPLDVLQKEIISEWRRDYASLLMRFDKNQDGVLDLNEWELVRMAAYLEAERRQQEGINELPQYHISKPKRSSMPYIISTDVIDKLLNDLSFQYKFYGTLCVISAIGTLYALIKLF